MRTSIGLEHGFVLFEKMKKSLSFLSLYSTAYALNVLCYYIATLLHCVALTTYLAYTDD